MARTMKHLTFDEFATNLARVFDQIIAEGRGVVVEKAGARAVLKPVDRRKPKQKGGSMAHREAHRPLTHAQQRHALAVIERLKQRQAELLAERGGQPFSPSWEILNELRDERSRQLQ